jgi:uncharacterized membrane protein
LREGQLNTSETSIIHADFVDEVTSKLKNDIAMAIAGIRNKTSNLKIRDMKALLFRCAAMIVGMPKVCWRLSLR